MNKNGTEPATAAREKTHPAFAGKKIDETGANAGQCHAFENELRDMSQRLLDNTKGLREEVGKQARLHPLATFGIAFAAGIMVARALRR